MKVCCRPYKCSTGAEWRAYPGVFAGLLRRTVPLDWRVRPREMDLNLGARPSGPWLFLIRTTSFAADVRCGCRAFCKCTANLQIKMTAPQPSSLLYHGMAPRSNAGPFTPHCTAVCETGYVRVVACQW